jgi:hypothetical protein
VPFGWERGGKTLIVSFVGFAVVVVVVVAGSGGGGGGERTEGVEFGGV